MKCDPCVATAPSTQDLVKAGVWWVNPRERDLRIEDDEDENSSSVYFTRLHVRYNRNSFPQDLQFQVTPNTENYQARYIITHPATGDFNCDAGKKYLKDLKQRRADEMEMLTRLTGKGYGDWDVVSNEEEKAVPAEATYASLSHETSERTKRTNGVILAGIGVLGAILLFGKRRNNPV